MRGRKYIGSGVYSASGFCAAGKDKDSDLNENEQNQKKRKRRRLLGCIIIFGIVLIIFVAILLGVIAFLSSAIFDKQQLKLEPIPMNNQAYMSAALKLQQMAAAMHNSQEGETKILSLTEDEVNSIICMTENAQLFIAMFAIAKISPQDIQKINDYKLRYGDGWFTLYYSKKMDFTTPFGAYINAKAVFVPYIEGKKRNVDIKSFQLGAVPIPKDIASAEVDGFISLAETEEKYEKCLSIIDSFQIDEDNNIVVRYYPARLKEVMNEFMKKN
jgi:hypothetical protein